MARRNGVLVYLLLKRASRSLFSQTLPIVFCMAVLTWMVTYGDWRLFGKAGFLEGFYDAQARSLSKGRIDVPYDAIPTESVARDQRIYGYFGLTPALPRLPLNLFLPKMYGRWHRLSMLLASLLAMAMALSLFRTLEVQLQVQGGERLRGLLCATLIAAVSLGSTNLFLCSESKVYQEAAIWGNALALAQAVFLVRYLAGRKAPWLALSCAAAFFAWFARVPQGAGWASWVRWLWLRPGGSKSFLAQPNCLPCGGSSWW